MTAIRRSGLATSALRYGVLGVGYWVLAAPSVLTPRTPNPQYRIPRPRALERLGQRLAGQAAHQVAPILGRRVDVLARVQVGCGGCFGRSLDRLRCGVLADQDFRRRVGDGGNLAHADVGQPRLRTPAALVQRNHRSRAHHRLRAGLARSLFVAPPAARRHGGEGNLDQHLVRLQRRRERADEELIAGEPTIAPFAPDVVARVQGHGDRGQMAGGVGVGDVAAEGAAVPDLRPGDVGHGFGQQRRALGDQRVMLDGAGARHRSDQHDRHRAQPGCRTARGCCSGLPGPRAVTGGSSSPAPGSGHPRGSSPSSPARPGDPRLRQGCWERNNQTEAGFMSAATSSFPDFGYSVWGIGYWVTTAPIPDTKYPIPGFSVLRQSIKPQR